MYQKIEVLAGTAKPNSDIRDETPSKRQKKDKKKNKGGEDAAVANVSKNVVESSVKGINDLLFKQSSISND